VGVICGINLASLLTNTESVTLNFYIGRQVMLGKTNVLSYANKAFAHSKPPNTQPS
jgi:hypothetical protein